MSFRKPQKSWCLLIVGKPFYSRDRLRIFQISILREHEPLPVFLAADWHWFLSKMGSGHNKKYILHLAASKDFRRLAKIHLCWVWKHTKPNIAWLYTSIYTKHNDDIRLTVLPKAWQQTAYKTYSPICWTNARVINHLPARQPTSFSIIDIDLIKKNMFNSFWKSWFSIHFCKPSRRSWLSTSHLFQDG